MKKRIFSLFLALSLLVIPARAAENSMDNFTRNPQRAYTGQFSDVPREHPFYDHIAALYELGLTVGKADGTFGPTDSISVSHLLIFAGRLRSLYRTGDAETGPAAHKTAGQAVCMPYLLYLKEEGLLGNELDNALFTPATRAQTAHVLANLLPEEALSPINADILTEAYARRIFLTDVDEYTPYQQDILKLYRCGVSHGSDDIGSFLPDQPITRGAVATMLARMTDPGQRIQLLWKPRDIPDVSGITLSNIIDPGRYYATPATAEELDAVVRYMLFLGTNHLTLRYPDLTAAQGRELMQALLSVVKTYCEQGYNSVEATVGEESISLTFSSAGAKAQTAAYREAALSAAKAVHDELWAEGYLTADMTEYEKARIYSLWVCANCDYDHGADSNSISHIPYSLFEKGIAVCDGYTGAYTYG